MSKSDIYMSVENLCHIYKLLFTEPDYTVDAENVDEETTPKYIVRLLGNERPSEAYEYKIIKKNSAYSRPNTRQLSPFRERTQHSDNDRLRDLFSDREREEEEEENRHILENDGENDIEYAVLLDQLWSKYKNNQGRFKSDDKNSEGVIKLYKDKIVKKRYPNNWGPVAFKRKRSPASNMDRSVLPDNNGNENMREDQGLFNANYNSYDVSNNDDDNDKDDMREEYAIAFQPLDDDSLSDLADEDQYTYENIEKRFPVTKRSSGSYNNYNSQRKRFATNQNKHNTKTLRNSAGTDPKIIGDLSKIFGNSESDFIKSPVKRNTDSVEGMHDTKPPTLIIHQNYTENNQNTTLHDDHSTDDHASNIHPPGVFGKEDHAHNDHGLDHNPDHKHNHDQDQHPHDDDKQNEKPIKIKKKSIDWSDYFGIDKRFKKSVSFVNNLNEDRLKKQYFDTFNKEVIYPLNSFRKNNYAKRSYVQPKPNMESDIQVNDQSHAQAEKRNSETDNESKLDNIDKKLKNMEGLIVDEALRYSNIEEIDSKEEQEMKEKLLTELAAAYSLEKMRKALKEFKQSLQMQKASSARSSPDKRVVIKKEKAQMTNDIPTQFEKIEDFEDEQGAGHYLNGKMEEQLSEGYMGGSGSHHSPVMSTGKESYISEVTLIFMEARIIYINLPIFYS